MAAKTFVDFAEVLKTILADARAAAQSGTPADIDTELGNLHGFIESSNNLIDGVDELDHVAIRACNDLILAGLDKTMVGRLAERTGEVAALIKNFAGQAATNSSNAAVLRLERVKSVGNAAANSIGEIKKLIDVTDDSTVDGKKFTETATAAIDSLKKLWAALPKVN